MLFAIIRISTQKLAFTFKYRTQTLNQTVLFAILQDISMKLIVMMMLKNFKALKRYYFPQKIPHKVFVVLRSKYS